MKKQKRLVGTKLIVLFGAALIAVFVVLFHKEELVKATLLTDTAGFWIRHQYYFKGVVS